MSEPSGLSLPTATLLPAVPDEKFDHIAALTRRVMGVPTALVTLVDTGRQVFPGAVGLPQPWQDHRSTPLTHSFCQHVVAEAAPLVVENARSHELVADNLAIDDLGVVAYAGMPLTDLDGNVIGSLCAIDGHPRSWTEHELGILAELAVVCSAELQLRESIHRTAVATERDRVAHAMHDLVIKDLLVLSMQLTSALSRCDGEPAEHMALAVDALDAVLVKMRLTLFDVNPPAP